MPPKITLKAAALSEACQGTLWQYQERQQSYATPDWARGHQQTIGSRQAALHASKTDSHSVLTEGNDLMGEHDVAVASAGSGGLVHARHGAFQELTTGA